MKLVIAEKPSVAQSLAKVIGANQKKDGYMEGNGYIVSWCVGHLIELANPEHYDEKYKKWRKEDLEHRLEKSRRLLNGEEEIELNPTGEEGILLIKALCGLERVVSNVNIPNTGMQIGNLPAEAVVETNAIFERDTIRPILAGNLPERVKELIMPAVENHETILEAALTCNEELVVKAFMNDPQVKGRKCEEQDIRLLVKDMLSATKKYLPEPALWS